MHLEVSRVVHINCAPQSLHLLADHAIPGALIHVIQAHGHGANKDAERGQNDQ